MITIMGVNLRNILLVKDIQALILKKLPFVGLFLLMVTNTYGQEATILATDAAAAESPLNTGTFTVTLDTPNTSGGNLAISYAVTGSATSGSDYTPLTGTVNIANNASSGTITVTPINDAAVEGPETVIVTLSNDAGYTVGTPNNATVTITSEDV
ncbi:Calx-beta domain-containing protein, partial [Eudoraea adriatica]|uniref:Calx-beta domain-containing protein n=1 Tax=Eudoraea adriatica TaxID=446681 RepID=UPI0014616E34